MIEWIRGRRPPAAVIATLRRAFLALLLFAALTLPFAEAACAKPAFSAIAVDARTGKILFSRDPDALTHPASLTKVMTLYILFGELKAGKVKLPSTHSAYFAPDVEPTLKTGIFTETVAALTLLK